MGITYRQKFYISAPKSSNVPSKLMRFADEEGVYLEILNIVEEGFIFKHQTVYCQVSADVKQQVIDFVNNVERSIERSKYNY